MSSISQDEFQKFVKLFYMNTCARVADVLWQAGHQGNSLQEIANGVELSVEPVKYHLEALKRDGIVKDVGSSSGQPVYAIEFNDLQHNIWLKAKTVSEIIGKV